MGPVDGHERHGRPPWPTLADEDPVQQVPNHVSCVHGRLKQCRTRRAVAVATTATSSSAAAGAAAARRRESFPRSAHPPSSAEIVG